MKTSIQRWGNSLAVRIPKPYAEDLGLDRESAVELEVEDGCLVIRPAATRRYAIGALLAQVSDDNLHSEQDYGDPAGREQW
jgi:antitoxin MazE